MAPPSLSATPQLLGKLKPAIQWMLLIALSAAVGTLLMWAGVPAALLLGPLLAGIVITVGGGRLRVPRRAFVLAQGVVGCMIAKMLPISLVSEVTAHWPLFLVGVVSVIGFSGLLGWLMTRMDILPGTTALWGMSPGAATAMTLMAEAYGADAQLVAFMQYLRVVIVLLVASMVTSVWGVHLDHSALAVTWFPPLHWQALLQTLALAVLGPVIAARLRIPAGGLLLPMFVGIVLVHLGWMTIELPPWLLLLAYALVGWRIGLRFTRPLLMHAAQAFPRMLACTVALILLCGGVGVLFVVVGGIDPLTAYLATSPGGADSVAIMAASSNVDIPFVMAMQMARFLTVLVLGPALAKYMAVRVGRALRRA